MATKKSRKRDDSSSSSSETISSSASQSSSSDSGSKHSDEETSSQNSDADVSVSDHPPKDDVSTTGSQPTGSVSEDEAGEGRDATSPEDFDKWYLRQITRQFGDDIDTIRKANDFTEESVPVLISMLKNFASTYTNDQKKQVMADAVTKDE